MDINTIASIKLTKASNTFFLSHTTTHEFLRADVLDGFNYILLIKGL